MSGVLQGALGGGRALLIGWFVPSLINLLVFGIVIVPRLSGFQALATSGNIDTARSTVFVLIGTVVLGLALAALQTPLYRILEGYLGWPERLYQARRRRRLADKHLLANRLEAADLVLREAARSDEESQILRAARMWSPAGSWPRTRGGAQSG
jgi:hypothetical protein